MRPRLSFANVVSVLALFIALGGSAYAFHLGKNSVGAKQLKKNAITESKIKDEAITAAKVKNGTLTGTQINASTLGAVPTAGNAATAGTASIADSLTAPEDWHEVGQPGQPQFNEGCETFVEDLTAKFFKDHEGVVHMEGEYECSSVADFAFTLPQGYRPDQSQVFPQPLAGGLLVILGSGPNDGTVFCETSKLCSLSGITFRAES